VTWLTAWLKRLYTNAHNRGNKQEELEATVLLESYDLVALTETWWDESMTGVQLSMATACSEGPSEEGGVEVLPYSSRNG